MVPKTPYDIFKLRNERVVKVRIKNYTIYVLPIVILFFCIDCRGAKEQMNSAEKKFYELYKEWKEYRKKPEFLVNSDSRISTHCTAYHGIIDMGKLALPFIFKELENGDILLIYAIQDITKIKITSKQISFDQEAQLWLDWWKKNKDTYMQDDKK